MNLKLIVKKMVFNAVLKIDSDISLDDIVIEVPKSRENGDFSTNIAIYSC